ncbi:MAG: aminoacyl-tRNA hydrolase [Candidatus Phytoplasma vitis]|nr:MAG: aminoacyl-tRNA hydrolase [Candidatus Phytoplasma vitis]
MKLIVGLGNPGIIYDNTPHNIGFMMIDFFLDYLKKNLIPFKFKKELFNLVYYVQINKKLIILLKPQIYMNNSGSAIEKIVKKYKVNIQDIFVLHDDIYLKAGNFKLKYKGGHGGHNGIKNIIEILNTDQFKRLKIGVNNNSSIPLNEYVLGFFEPQIKKDIFNKFPIFVDILKYFIDDIPFEKIFNFLNKK